jgi:hypothetical protein
MQRADMKMHGRYNWTNQSERLVYIGRNWSGNGYWHQFEKVDAPGVVWCEILDSNLHMIEETAATACHCGNTHEADYIRFAGRCRSCQNDLDARQPSAKEA